MRSILVFVLMLLTSMTSTKAFAQPHESGNDGSDRQGDRKQAVKEAFRDYLDAFYRGDVETIDAYEADEWIIMSDEGRRSPGDTTDRYVHISARVRAGDWLAQPVQFDLANVHVRMFGDVAVTYGTSNVAIPGEEPVDVLSTSVWIPNQPNGWEMIQLHYNVLPNLEDQDAEANGSSDDIAREIREAEESWNELADFSHDSAAVAAIVADDYILADPDGRVYGKADVLEWVADETYVGERASLDDVRVFAHGDDVAVSQYVLDYAGLWEGKATSGKLRYTNTWVRRNGSWQVVASHATQVRE